MDPIAYGWSDNVSNRDGFYYSNHLCILLTPIDTSPSDGIALLERLARCSLSPPAASGGIFVPHPYLFCNSPRAQPMQSPEPLAQPTAGGSAGWPPQTPNTCRHAS